MAPVPVAAAMARTALNIAARPKRRIVRFPLLMVVSPRWRARPIKGENVLARRWASGLAGSAGGLALGSWLEGVPVVPGAGSRIGAGMAKEGTGCRMRPAACMRRCARWSIVR